MKAHIQTEPRCALVWGFGSEAAGCGALERTARAFRVRLRPVDAGDLGAAVGDLCRGLASPAPALPLQVPRGPALIVSGLRHDNGDLSAFLDAVKSGGAEFPLRAMVTPTSKGWTLAQLLLELERERQAVEAPQ